MPYLLDANVPITANNTYYPIDQVPEFWSWLQFQATSGYVKIPLEIMDEIKAGREDNDLLIDWISQDEIEAALLFDEDVDTDLERHVVSEGHSDNLTDDQIENLGRDPFLIAHALANSAERCVMTIEVSKPSRQPQNRKIPDVCNALGVQWCGPFILNRKPGFHTGWQK